MRCEVVPSEFSNLVPFSSSSYSSYYPENSENVFGFISKNGLWLYQIHGTVIDIYCIESGKWCGGHCFAKSLKNPFAKITAAVEFTSSHLSYPCLLLAVNQDDESLLCLFDVDSCKVVRAILMPGRERGFPAKPVGRQKRIFFGFKRGEKNFLPKKKQHVLLHLNVESSRGSSFEFKSRSSTLGKFPNGDVYVTSLKYIPSLTTLAVGFNFGGIQLWELHHLTLQFTIANDHEQAIINFAFQEPENDPRNFCYLWVFKGHSIAEEELPTTISVATLYSLTYFKREFVESFGALYTELQTCNRRFELPLISDLYSSPNSGTIGSRLMSCQIINQKDLHHALDVASANESDSVSEDMSLCFLSWEVWPNTQHLPLSYHLAVFDLNQWYQAHMPAIFRCHSNELSPYLGIFSMKETMKCLNNEEILSLYAIPQSIKKFKSLLVSEEFFYPSSLSFQQISFSENGVCKTTYFGFQKHLLFEVGELGPQILLNPKEIYPSLMKSGLIPDSHIGADNTPLVVQREMLFQLALEYHLPFFFMKCLKEWRYSASTDVLLIDGLVKESGVSSSWQEKNGTGNYPPPSIYAALAGYLMDGVTIELKHALMYYLLLDLQDMNANSTFLNGLKKFPQIFGLSKSNTKLLKAFWYLDRRDTKNAIKKLLHPAVRVCDILPWQHQRIIKSFLFWKAPQNALKYINHMEPPQTSLEDMKLHLSVLLSCGAITQAYEYQRKKQEMGFGNELLNHLFLGCQELRKMKDLIYLPLNSLESWALVQFLNESKDPRAQELLVIYHLLHCNFFEAAKVNEKLSRLLMNKLASIYETSIHERSIDREALVESLMAAVSHTEKCLVEEMKRLPSDATKKEESGQNSMRTPKSLAGDIVSLLQTPPIHRRKSSVMKSKILESTPTITPQSILKKKQDSKKQVQLDFHTAPTPPLGSEDESSEDKAMEVDRNLENNLPSNNENMSRQIRFDLPTEAQESKMASSFRLAAQSNVPKSDIFSGRQENSENAKASKETGRTSFGSLTREPLRSLKKRISFHDESSSIKAAEAAMDVEILDKTEEGRKEVSPEKISSLPQIEADISLDREGETGMPISSFIANSEISKPVIDITHTDSTACKTSEDDDVEILLEVQGHGQSFQRSHLSPQLSLRSNFPESKEQKTTFLEGFQSGLLSGSKTSTKIDEKENSPGHSTASEDCFIIEQTLIDDHSENETFYSPCSENLNFTRASFTFSEPVALFQENSNPPAIPEESGSVIENAFSYDFSEQRPSELNRTISFDFAEPSDGILDHGIASLPSNSKFSSVENDMGQFMEDSSESSKPMCTTFCFTENVPIANAESISYTKEENLTEKSSESNFATELEQPQVQMEDTAEPPLQFQFSKPVEEYETVSDEKTVAMEIIESSTCETVTEPLSSSESSISQDKFTFAKPISLKTSEEFSTYLDDKNIEGIAGSDKTLTTSESSIAGKTATIYKPRFTFSKPLSNKIIEETEVPGNEYSKPQITEDNKSELAVELPITTEINATRKSRFTFGKKNNADKTIVKSSASEVNIFESNKSEVASELHIVEENPTVSKHRFTFSKPLPLKPSEELHSVSEEKGSKMDITESDVSTRSRFTFSKPILLSEKTISNEKDANITVSESNTQTEKKQVSITETSLRTSHKTFMFTRSKSTSKTSDDEAKQESEKPSEINESNIKTDFLLSETAGTYEEFSSSLKKGASDEGTSEKSGQKTLLSSPHSAAEPESQIHGTSLKTDVKIKANTTKKKTTMKTDKSTATTPSISKKKKGKGKSSQKIEFSFAEPTSPATPEILEILAKTPEVPLPSFMFSPPMTRGRLRKKRMDESMGSSFCSVTSEMSFVSQPPPMDSILEGIIQEKKLEPRRTSKATTKKRSAARKPRPQSHLEISSMSSILDESKMISPSKKSSPSSPKNTSARHSMILRQTKVKHKPENL
ncbi:Protein ELYS like protein [Argiope bruennichi]|uniref:Protein ELYS like protein n=1 Tax=Argiope bruennichi TaxID=94029 RepID=A0A8T0FPQ2_ARGBR|nr:Protein ELYS like protein [Argiope bruennichi]